ncbi:glycosyltransferase [Gemmatimonadota bacterium]
MALPFLLLLPWLLLGAFFLVRVRLPHGLPSPLQDDSDAPFVSVIVPARNEERNILTCLGSLAAARYPRFEIVVVNDQSEDRTGELARASPPGNAEALRVVEGRPLPSGWLGKPWACQQGGEAAEGDLLLFTDADTVHGPDLLSRSVHGLQGSGSDVLSLMGRQLLGSFWEKLVQPRFFVLLAARFASLPGPRKPEDWIHAIANGQFILMPRDVWEALGGHGAVRGEVAEDLRLAQILVREGRKLLIFAAEDALSTRMYHNLGELVAGWSKNVATGSKQVTRGWFRALAIPTVIAFEVVIWILPAAVLVAGLAGSLAPELTAWAVVTTILSVLFWAIASFRFRVNPAFGLLFPLGAAVESYILVKSWIRGRRVEWKGRVYELEDDSGEGARPSGTLHP